MTSSLKWTCLFCAAALLLTHCEKGPTEVDSPVHETFQIAQVMTDSNVIDGLHEQGMTTTDNDSIAQRMNRALRRLDGMLDRVHDIVRRHDHAEAKGLYFEARQAQAEAIVAARQDSFDVAFEWIQKSRFLAIEAVNLVRDDIREDREAVREQLVAKAEEVKTLISEVAELLEEGNYPVAGRLLNKARFHLHTAHDALRGGFLRDAGFHLREAERYARMSRRIVTESI